MSKFEIKGSDTSGYHFELKSRHGKAILVSEKHPTFLACEEAIRFVRKNKQNKSRIKRITTLGGKWYYLFIGKMGELIAKSGKYATVGKREKALHALKGHIESA